jgi:AcrR family transcriptional regulator
MAERTAAGRPGDQPLRERAIHRGLADQYAQASDEVDRIVEATYRVIEREGSVDPKVRDILAESGLATQAFYRHFASKDELLLVILDDGRRQLADYLVHRMEKVASKGPLAEVRAWILGILAQAADEGAAARTRPFTVGNHRLGERFPEEQAASVALLIDILAGAIVRAVDAGEIGTVDASRSARFVYLVAVGEMEAHILAGTSPTRADTDAVVAFSLRALGTPPT